MTLRVTPQIRQYLADLSEGIREEQRFKGVPIEGIAAQLIADGTMKRIMAELSAEIPRSIPPSPHSR